jgi:hypothetical protein
VTGFQKIKGLNMKILRMILAVPAGIVFVFATHAGTDFVLESLGIFTPPDQGFFITWMVVTATIYRTVYNVGAGYVTALVAPDHKMVHVWILGIIGLVMSTVAAIIFIPANLGPAWYPIALAVLALPSVWLGGKLRTK